MNDNYIWKEKRIYQNGEYTQKKVKLIDMNESELNKAYMHCKQMLFNSDRKNPGRILILDEITNQINKCGAELALRWFLSQTDSKGNIMYSPINIMAKCKNWLELVPKTPNKKYVLKDFVQTIPDFDNISIDLIMKACRDALGAFDHSKITYSFIYRLGIYFTPDELKELQMFTKYNSLTEILDVIKTRLNLNDTCNIKINYEGLNESEFIDMIHLKKYHKNICKYSELSTSQLQTLRNKVLFAFQEEIAKQATIWKKLMEQIEEVATYKHYTLK